MRTTVSLAVFIAFAAAAVCSSAAAATTGSIEDVASIVIFMQENRAFDHYYGTLDGVRPASVCSPGFM